MRPLSRERPGRAGGPDAAPRAPRRREDEGPGGPPADGRLAAGEPDRSGPLLGAALLASFSLHLLLAGRVPPGIDKDTANEVLRGLRLVVLGRLEVLSFSNGPSAETLYLYVVGAAVRLLGPRPLAVVLPAAAVATLTLLLLVLLVRRLAPRSSWGVPVALGAGSLWLFHYGQVGLRAVSAPFFLVLCALALGAAEGRDVKPLRSLLAGGGLGLSVYAYSACRLLPLAWAVHEALRFALRRGERRVVVRQALLAGAGILFVSIPNLLFLSEYPSLFLDRGSYAVRGSVADRLSNLAATWLVPFGYPDRYRACFGEGHAFDQSGVGLTSSGVDPVDPLTAGLLLVGLVPALRLAARAETSFCLVALAVANVLLGLTGPSLTRMLVVVPVYLLLASLGLAELRRRGVRRWAVSVALTLFLAAQAWRYAAVYGPSREASENAQAVANEMGARARDLVREGKRVLVATSASRAVVLLYCYRDFERTWTAGPDGAAGLPRDAAAFGPDVVLVERSPAFEAFRRGLPGRSAGGGVAWDEVPTPSLAAALPGPPPRGNVRRLWSDVRL